MTLSFSSVVSVVSLLVSASVAWLTLFRRGVLAMTEPVQIAFVFEEDKPKIFLRTLLFATGKRGYVIEGLYLRVRNAGSSHTFGFWSYGQRNDLIVAGGLRVTEEGASFNHHFLQIEDNSGFEFQEGGYEIAVFARTVNRSKAQLLSTVRVTLPNAEASLLRFRRTTGVLFTKEPDKETYHASLREKNTNPPS